MSQSEAEDYCIERLNRFQLYIEKAIKYPKVRLKLLKEIRQLEIKEDVWDINNG